MFNVRVKRYLNTEQIQIFSQPLMSKGEELEDRRKVIRDTGEIVPTNRRIIDDVFNMQKKVNFEGMEFEYPSQEVGSYMHDEEQNIERSVRRTKNKIYDIAKSNNWEWFCTLTFNKERVDRYNFSAVTQKLSDWLKRMRKLCPDMKYLVVPEQHEDGAWHFHGLFSNVENMEFVDSGKRDKHRRVVYNVGKYRFGWTEATKIDSVERAMSYIAKYTTKELCEVTKGHKRYWCSRNVNLPTVEEFFCEGHDAFKRYVLSQESSAYVKEVYSEFTDVTYIEIPIYTTNTSLLSQVR